MFNIFLDLDGVLVTERCTRARLNMISLMEKNTTPIFVLTKEQHFNS